MAKVLWVAEIGSAHKGNPALAFELIKQAAQAGADIAKFQFGWTKEAQEAHGLTYNPVRWVDEWSRLLAEWCEHFNIELMASIWSRTGLDTARKVDMKRYKIAAQMRDTALTKDILSDGKETFISDSIGRGDMGELVKGIYCVSKYPTYPKDIQMPKKFTDYYGYSDHAHGIEACLLAVARDALYIEKHFCLDKSDMVTRDTPFSATPAEFAEMVRIGNGLRRLLDAAL